MNAEKEEKYIIKKPVVVMPDGILNNLTSEEVKDASEKAGMDISSVRRILKGNTNCTIESLSSLFGARGFVNLNLPIPDSPLLRLYLRQRADNLDYILRLPSVNDYGPIFNFFSKATGTNAMMDSMKYDLYMLNSIATYSTIASPNDPTPSNMLHDFMKEFAHYVVDKADKSKFEKNSPDK